MKATPFDTERDRLNAHAGFALDIKRHEVGYTLMMNFQGQTASLTYLLSETPTHGGQTSAFEAIPQHGSETYVELSEDMFEAPYPGQFNCRIKSVAIRFRGLVLRASARTHA